MRRQDYILRQMAQLAAALRGIAGLAREKRYGEALQALGEAFRAHLGLDMALAGALEQEALVELMMGAPSAAIGYGRCLLAARLLKEAGDIYIAQGAEDRAYDANAKALRLLLEALLGAGSADLPDYAPDVHELVDALRDYVLPWPTNSRLFGFYERACEFGTAEDLLFQMIQDEQEPDAVLDLGQAFYERLLQRSDSELAAGNLPRSEAKEGRRELEKLRRRKPAGSRAS